MKSCDVAIKNGISKGEKSQKFAFTLAEVLIALVIIGVVAAITVPVLFENYKKQETISRLKKAYSVISNGLRMSQTENGPFSSWEIGADMTDVEGYFNKYWVPYFQNITKYNWAKDLGYEDNFCWTNLNGRRIGWQVKSDDSRILFTLADGTVVFYPRNTTDSDGNPAYTRYFYVDINGSKKPNVIGKDVFIFNVVDYDNLKPYCHERNETVINNNCKKSISENNTNCCTAKIMYDGWQIKEDYPW